MVKFIIDSESSKILEQLVPMENEYSTINLKLLDRNESEYIVLKQNPGELGEKAVLIDKQLIKGVIYPENNSPIRYWFTTPTPTPTSEPTLTATPTSTTTPS
jgi:hypothetical protein